MWLSRHFRCLEHTGHKDVLLSQNIAGILTRNGAYDLQHSKDLSYLQRRKICDAIAASSIFENCAGVETAQNRCLGFKEFREFLEDYQEEHLDDQDIIALIQVGIYEMKRSWDDSAQFYYILFFLKYFRKSFS